jgi:hypothetical protein
MMEKVVGYWEGKYEPREILRSKLTNVLTCLRWEPQIDYKARAVNTGEGFSCCLWLFPKFTAMWDEARHKKRSCTDRGGITRGEVILAESTGELLASPDMSW